jgi:hypothetical protein
MARMSLRMSPELAKKLEKEARILSRLGGETVTVSDLVRTCIQEKFPEVAARKKRETMAASKLGEEVIKLREHHGHLVRDLEALVQTLGETIPLLATREQVDSLTDGIAAVITSFRGR